MYGCHFEPVGCHNLLSKLRYFSPICVNNVKSVGVLITDRGIKISVEMKDINQ